MCRAGGPRCPQTPGKQARTKLARAVNKQIASSGMSADEWKLANAVDYDTLCAVAFKDTPALEEPEEEPQDPSWIDAYYAMKEDRDSSFSWGQNDEPDSSYSWYDDDEEEGDESEKEESFGDWAREMMSHPYSPLYPDTPLPTNRHLLPEDAVIKSPTPNPVFVYGTLRNGCGNYHWALEDKTQREKKSVKLPGTRMYTNGGFPYVVPDDSNAEGVTGDLMYPFYDGHEDVMNGLDSLEGTHELNSDSNMYNRVLMYVQTGEKEYTQSWVYIPPENSAADIRYRYPEVESGDWVEEMGDRG